MRKCFKDAWKTFFLSPDFFHQNTNHANGPPLWLDKTRRDVLYIKAGTAKNRLQRRPSNGHSIAECTERTRQANEDNGPPLLLVCILSTL